MNHYVKWKGEDAYLVDDSRWGETKFSWTPKIKWATAFRSEKEAREAYEKSGAGGVQYLEIVNE